MSRADLGEMLKAAEKAGFIGGSDYLKLKEGQNRVRLIDGPLPHPGSYQGRPNFRWLWYVIDRTDNEIKPFFMPHRIYKALAALQQSEDFGFDAIPMPYDVIVNAKGAGTKDVEYSLLPTRKELGSEELAGLTKKKSLKELQEQLRAKDEGRQEERTTAVEHFDPDEVAQEVPF